MHNTRSHSTPMSTRHSPTGMPINPTPTHHSHCSSVRWVVEVNSPPYSTINTWNKKVNRMIPQKILLRSTPSNTLSSAATHRTTYNLYVSTHAHYTHINRHAHTHTHTHIHTHTHTHTHNTHNTHTHTHIHTHIHIQRHDRATYTRRHTAHIRTIAKLAAINLVKDLTHDKGVEHECKVHARVRLDSKVVVTAKQHWEAHDELTTRHTRL